MPHWPAGGRPGPAVRGRAVQFRDTLTTDSLSLLQGLSFKAGLGSISRSGPLVRRGSVLDPSRAVSGAVLPLMDAATEGVPRFLAKECFGIRRRAEAKHEQSHTV